MTNKKKLETVITRYWKTGFVITVAKLFYIQVGWKLMGEETKKRKALKTIKERYTT